MKFSAPRATMKIRMTPMAIMARLRVQSAL